MTGHTVTLYCGKNIDDMNVDELRDALREAARLLDEAYRRALDESRLRDRIA